MSGEKFHPLVELTLLEGVERGFHASIVPSNKSDRGFLVEVLFGVTGIDGVRNYSRPILAEAKHDLEIPRSLIHQGGYGESSEQDTRIRSYLRSVERAFSLKKIEFGVFAERGDSISGPRRIEIEVVGNDAVYQASFWEQEDDYHWKWRELFVDKTIFVIPSDIDDDVTLIVLGMRAIR